MLQAELDRVSNHRLLPPLDTTRYQLPAPTTPDDEEQWKEALKNARAQLEHQKTRYVRVTPSSGLPSRDDPYRHINLALLQQYGSNAWRIHNYLNEATAKNIEKALEDLNNLTTEVNRDRKNFQVSNQKYIMRRGR